jgi:subtilisin family serine protease
MTSSTTPHRGLASKHFAALALAVAAALATGVAEAGSPPRWVSGELLVGFRAGVGATGRHNMYRKHGADFLEDVGQGISVARIRVPAAGEEAMMRRLASLPQVKFVEKNYEYETALVPNDPEYKGLSPQWYLPKIGAEQAWDLTQGGANAVIAILDSGIDATQPDLVGKLVPGHNTYTAATPDDTTDPYGHGTEVAGVAGAWTNNGVGIAGVAGASPLMPVRVTNTSGAATSASIANGIIWAADHGARVVNLSFNNLAGNATVLAAAEYAYNKGTLVVAASGNCGCADATVETPFILSVSATDETDTSAYFSSTGPYVDLSAPGTNILSTAKYGLYMPNSGTSLASPIVAGVAALMFSAKPELTPLLATQMLEATAVDVNGGGYDTTFGYGRVDALAAVNLALNYQPPVDTTAPTVALASPGNGATVTGTVVVNVAADDNVGVVKVDLYVDNVYFANDTTSPYSFAWDTTGLTNGAHTLVATAFDARGNSASTTALAVSVANKAPDTLPPTVLINAPAAGATVAGTTTVTATATDNVGVTGVDLLVDGALVASDASAPYAFSWNTTGLADGVHTLDVKASDAAGNVSHATRSVTVANAPPPPPPPPVAHAPVAGNDAFGAPYRATSAYTAQVLAILANDSDADGDLNAASVRITASPDKGGSVKVNSNGTVSYTPKRGYRGVETFRYTVKDKRGVASNTATVTVAVDTSVPATVQAISGAATDKREAMWTSDKERSGKLKNAR